MTKKFFPLFLEISGKKVVVVGGGNIALRRVKTLLQFDFEILVVAKTLHPDLLALHNESKTSALQFRQGEWCQTDLKDAFLVFACTNDRAVNDTIGKTAKAQGILTSVCDKKEDCDFYFPGVVNTDTLTVAVVGDGSDHKAVAKATQMIREQL